MRTNGYLELLGPDLQRIVSATNELLMISGTYDKLRQRQGVFRKSYIITENQNKIFDAKLQFVCHLAMLVGFDIFYNDINYDECGIRRRLCYRDPKMHFLTRNDVFRRTLRKNPFRGVGCSLIEEPQKRRKN